MELYSYVVLARFCVNSCFITIIITIIVKIGILLIYFPSFHCISQRCCYYRRKIMELMVFKWGTWNGNYRNRIESFLSAFMHYSLLTSIKSSPVPTLIFVVTLSEILNFSFEGIDSKEKLEKKKWCKNILRDLLLFRWLILRLAFYCVLSSFGEEFSRVVTQIFCCLILFLDVFVTKDD